MEVETEETLIRVTTKEADVDQAQAIWVFVRDRRPTKASSRHIQQAFWAVMIWTEETKSSYHKLL